jgi:5'-3' exonuclease
MAADDARVERVLICTPDKDLAQCVVGERVVQFDRRRRQIVDDVGVRAKFGVPPSSIADYLALVGDGADGYPGIKGWGAKSASAVLARYGHLENIPTSAAEWDVAVRGASRLADTLAAERDLALLFREIATVRRDALVGGGVDELEWPGPGPALREMFERLDAPELAERARRVAQKKASNT